MFREPGSGTKGERLRCVDIAEAGRGQVIDWAQRAEREGTVGSKGLEEEEEEEDIIAIENKQWREMGCLESREGIV